MILEANRILADWFSHATYGVNAKLAVMDFDGSDAAFTLGLVADETRNGIVARDQVPANYSRMLLITSDALRGIDGEVLTYIRKAELTLIVRFVTRSSATESATRDGSYCIRAALQSLKDLETTAAGAAARVRNGVSWFAVSSVESALMYQPLEEAVVAAALKVTVVLRDTLA